MPYNGITTPSITVQFLKSGVWTTVTTTDIMNISFNRGRIRPTTFDDSGLAVLKFNNTSGYYDPDYTGASSPWVISGVSILRAGLKMRIFATWASVDYVLFVGFLDTTLVDQSFIPSVQMRFADGISQISLAQAPALATAAFAETAATRVGRMLDYASWSATDRSLSGSTNLLATYQNTSAMQMINECVNSISGRFYISRTGFATLVPIADKFTRPTRLLFDDAGAANSVGYTGVVTNPGVDYVVNQAVVGRGSANQVSSKYNPSIASYGIKRQDVYAPVLTDTNATNLALYLSRKNAAPTTYVEKLDFNAIALDTLYPDFLQAELSDQITVIRHTYDGRTLNMNLVIESMNHTITSDNWRVSYTTSTMNPYSITI
jgi:hypothetical protein